jgi:hypothetical protein
MLLWDYQNPTTTKEQGEKNGRINKGIKYNYEEMIKRNYSSHINNYYFLQDSFLGGESYKYPKYSIQNIIHTTIIDEKPIVSFTKENSYLIPHRQETIESFRKRQECAVYINLVEPIVSAFVSPLEQVSRTFSNEDLLNFFKKGKVFYDELDYSSFIKFVAEQTAEFGHVFVVIDHITDESGKVIAIKPLILNPIQVKDVYLSEEDKSFIGLSWERADGKVVFVSSEGFKIYDEKEEEVIKTIPLQDGLPFPVKVVYFKKDMSKDYPFGISLVLDTAEIGKKIYNLSSWLDEIAKNTGFPFLGIPFNQDNGSIPPESKLAIGTSKAIAYPANAGAPQYIEPSGNSAQQIREIIKEEIKRAFQMKGLNSFEMIDSQASSGVSIKIRNNFYESKAKTFLESIEALEIWIMEIASQLLGLKEKEWQIVYPTNLVAPDVSGQINNWISVLRTAKEFGFTITPELFKTVFGQILDQGFSLSQEEKDKIMNELDSKNLGSGE